MVLPKIISYVERDSVWHRANPCTKLLIVTTLVFSPWISERFLLSALIILAISLIMSKSMRDLTHIYTVILVFSVIFLPLNTLLYSSLIKEKTYLLKPWITLEGLLLAVIALMRIVIGLLAIGLFFVTTSPEELEDFLLRLKFPASFILALTVSTMFAPMLLEEITRIKMAQSLRGAFRGGFINRIKAYARVLGIPLIVSALRRAIRLAEAIELWGAPSPNRTVFTSISFKKEDMVLISMLAFLVSLCTLVPF
ncbi:MAG: energy-coupling factor transporter transmembrane component T family protein [Candidatus Njordarchaeales archaeon]